MTGGVSQRPTDSIKANIRTGIVNFSNMNSSVLSWLTSHILTSLVATPAFVHGHDERETTGYVAAVAEPSLLPFLSLSLPKKLDRLPVHLQLQTNSRAASDHTICQTIPGGTLASNTPLDSSCRSTSSTKNPPFFLPPVSQRLGEVKLQDYDSLWMAGEKNLEKVPLLPEKLHM